MNEFLFEQSALVLAQLPVLRLLLPHLPVFLHRGQLAALVEALRHG